jgi:hypothetical protein
MYITGEYDRKHLCRGATDEVFHVLFFALFFPVA